MNHVECIENAYLVIKDGISSGKNANFPDEPSQNTQVVRKNG